VIGRLRGVLAAKQPPFLLLDVAGVGYEVEAPMSTFYKLPEVGGKVTLHTHLVVRDDAHLLYGFDTLSERRLFRDLIRVGGVGPRLALAILSGMDTDAFVRCVQDRDSSSLVRLPGIGKRTAERLIVEMRDRLADWQVAPSTVVTAGSGASAGAPPRSPVADAVSALIALGYKPPEASRLVSAVEDQDRLSVEEIIRRALKTG
jgi:Holliday junction DNA helicase RuvA